MRPPTSYCPAHTWSEEKRAQHRRESSRERQRRYDQNNRDPELKRFYNSAAWKRVRTVVLARDQHLCRMCLKERRITPAEHVDHIVPVREAWERRLDPDNCRALCASCHSKRTARDRRKAMGGKPLY